MDYHINSFLDHRQLPQSLSILSIISDHKLLLHFTCWLADKVVNCKKPPT